MSTDDKIYRRHFDADSGESLALVAKQIEPSSRVLDIGCGAGDLGGYLRTEKQCYVVGMDYSTESLAVAGDKLDATWQIDLNSQLPHDITDDTFDVIVLADILEHIYMPGAILQSAEKLLKPGGKLLISIPNAGYVGALLSLYDDEWQYREEGILDRTHIRFYTRKSIIELLKLSGYDAVICDRVFRDLWDSEFTQRLDNQASSVRDWLLAKPEGAAYQFIIEARPSAQKHTFAEVPIYPSMSEQHIVKLYWLSDDSGAFTPEKMQIQRGTMGATSQLSFPVGDSTLKQLRLDFADRRSIYLINQVAIFAGEKLLWSSQNDGCQLTIGHAYSQQARLPMTVMAHSNQAYLHFVLPEEQTGTNISVTIDMSAPVSEQNTTFLNAVSVDQYNVAIKEQQRLATELVNVHKETGAYLGTLEATLENERAQFQTVQVQHQNAVTDSLKMIATLEQTIAALEQSLKKLQTEQRNTQQHLTDLLQSSSWKITAPLRKIIHLIR